MKLTHEAYDQITVVQLVGDLTADDIDPLRRLVHNQLDDNTRDFVLDVKQLDFVDSRGLETLLWIQEQAGERLGQLRLVEPTENVRQILYMTRLNKSFDTHDDVESAVRSLR